MSSTNWREYQHATADVFRRLGCNAQVDFPAQGVRAKHDVDVYATFLRSGILCTWVVECKLWSSRVPKEKVMALKSIVDDLGADRGIIICEKGFQPGAYDAARGTNITLITSLDEFARTALAATTEVPLTLDATNGQTPMYKFPGSFRPHDIQTYRDRLITANWGDGSISIVNPAVKSVVRTIELDRYEATSPRTGERVIRAHPPGSLAVADGRLFVGQVFSDVILVIDLATQSVIKRIQVPGGGEGELAVSADERLVYFASNKVSQFFVIDSATYAVSTFPYPPRGRGCMSLLKHPTKDLLYIGISRGGNIGGRYYPHANCYLAIFDLGRSQYVAETQLAEFIDGRVDDATPACLTFDDRYNRLYVGMFQSLRGIAVVDPDTGQLQGNVRFQPNGSKPVFRWVDPLSQALTDDKVVSVNRNNRELALLDRATLEVERVIPLGEAPNGPKSVTIWNKQAVVTYPGRDGLIFVPLG